jgi:hypothetical protein
MRWPFITIFAILAALHACRPPEAPQDQSAQTTTSLPSDFSNFYQQFHLDSNFQYDHIIFPLQGLPANADAETIESGNFYWTKDIWVLHRPVDFETSDFTRELIPMGDDIVLEKIIHRNGQTGMLRRFAKINEEWYLIYFADLNRIKS